MQGINLLLFLWETSLDFSGVVDSAVKLSKERSHPGGVGESVRWV